MSNGDASIVGEHLDADELSSYAENALPAAARAHYTEHLAECAGCRELIVQLSSSIGVVAAEQSAKVPGPSGLRNFLASLFSPMVLRYAIPAVGLIVVAAIGFFTLRQDQGDLANRQAGTPPAPANVNPTFSYSDPGGNAGQRNSGDKNTAPTVETRNAPPIKSAPEGDVAAAPPNAPPVVGLHAEVNKDAAAKKADDQQTAANAAPAPQPTPAPVVATEEARKAEAEPPKDVSQRAASNLPLVRPSTTSEYEKSKSRRDQEVAGAGAGAGSRTEGSRNAERSTRERAPSPSASRVLRQAEGADQSADEETRSVAGRRFRKQGNLWIDTGFTSGTSTVNVGRGSEQFRALVADEPEIKTIADQLGGEIIVVWKGRAYRIR